MEIFQNNIQLYFYVIKIKIRDKREKWLFAYTEKKI